MDEVAASKSGERSDPTGERRDTRSFLNGYATAVGVLVIGSAPPESSPHLKPFYISLIRLLEAFDGLGFLSYINPRTIIVVDTIDQALARLYLGLVGTLSSRDTSFRL